MSSPIPFRLPYAATADSTEYLEALRKKRALIGAFTTALDAWISNICKAGAFELSVALFNLLVIDLDNQIEAVMNPPAGRTMSYAPSPEELVGAQEQVELYQTQVDAMETTAEKLPEEMRPFALIALPMLKQQLRGAIEFRDRLQKALEASDTKEKQSESTTERIYHCAPCEVELVSEMKKEQGPPKCPHCGAPMALDVPIFPKPGEVLYDITDPRRPEYSPPPKAEERYSREEFERDQMGETGDRLAKKFPLGSNELAYACAVCGGRIVNTPDGIFEHAETCPGPGAKLEY